MATILHIWANPKPINESYSLRLAQAFIERYRQLRPQDEIIDLDLYQQEIPFIDGDVLRGWEQGMEAASAETRAKLLAIDQLTDSFIQADKYIFVTPMWNLSIPPMMKAYIDTICIAGKTFKYTAQGSVGLLRGKKAVHIQARGGIYSRGPLRDLELGDRYLRSILTFLGVEDVQSVIAEGMAQNPEEAEVIFQAALARARQAAERFALGPEAQLEKHQHHPVHPVH